MADRTPGQHQVFGKKGKVALIVAIGLIVVLLAVIVVLLLSRGSSGTEIPEAPEETKRNVVVNASNAEEIAEEMISQEYIAPGYYSASMTTTWHFASGDEVSEDAYVENVAENTNDVYFDLFLSEQEDEPIYQSPVIPRGSELEKIALDKPLEAGTYDCVLIYHLVDEEQNTVSTLRVAVTLVVES